MKNETRCALEAAKYHLNMMKETINTIDQFSYNRCAFISAARNITFYMQKQFKKTTGFNNWYQTKREIMKNDEDLIRLNDERKKCVHSDNRIYEMKYFIKSMTDEFQHSDEFSYNLNAFITAARSTAEHIDETRGNISLESIFSKKLAAFQIHRSTVTTGATCEQALSTGALLVNPREPDQRKAPETLTNLPKMPIPKEPKTLERWFWETGRYLNMNDRPYFERKDVIESCNRILSKLERQIKQYDYINPTRESLDACNDRTNEIIFWQEQLRKLEDMVHECEIRFLK